MQNGSSGKPNVARYAVLVPLSIVRQNIAFTLEAQNVPKSEAEKRVHDVAHLLQIEHLLRLRPKALSGGDRQRVTLARALVRRPKAFLMDEPLGALDADFRATMRAEIKRLHLAQHATTVYVTHDQIEAMAMSDRIVVMSNAAVQQVGTPAQVYYDPANLFVARFIGSPGMNLIQGRYVNGVVHLPGDNRLSVATRWHASHADGTLRVNKSGIQMPSPLNATGLPSSFTLGIRPEDVQPVNDGAFTGQISLVEPLGIETILYIKSGEQTLLSIVSGMTHYRLGEQIHLSVAPERLHYFDSNGARIN